MPATREKTEILVSVDENHRGKLSEVVKKLKAAGLRVDQQMQALGIVTGMADASQLGALSRVEGVASVEASREFQLSPPYSDVQ